MGIKILSEIQYQFSLNEYPLAQSWHTMNKNKGETVSCTDNI